MLRKFSLALVAILAAACSGSAPQPAPSAAPFTFNGHRVEDLVIPVTRFAAGTVVAAEFAVTADTLEEQSSREDRAAVHEILTRNGYISGHARRFESNNGGALPNQRQVSVLLFRDHPAARDAAASMTALRVAQGLHEYRLSERIGDESSLIGANLQIPDPAGDKFAVVWEVHYAYLNAVVVSFAYDDRDAAFAEDATNLALTELRFLREAVARQTPKPS